jgi:lactate dehydrogenase-like 2-hydroxyacid dehydrogenase
VIAACPKLEIIAVYGVGFDALDLDACRAFGIRVTNTLDVLNGDVADLGVAMMLAVARTCGFRIGRRRRSGRDRSASGRPSAASAVPTCTTTTTAASGLEPESSRNGGTARRDAPRYSPGRRAAG